MTDPKSNPKSLTGGGSFPLMDCRRLPEVSLARKIKGPSDQIKLPLLGMHPPGAPHGLLSPPNLNSISCHNFAFSLRHFFHRRGPPLSSLLSRECFPYLSRRTDFKVKPRQSWQQGACSGEIWISLPIWGLQFPAKSRRNNAAKACTRCPSARSMSLVSRNEVRCMSPSVLHCHARVVPWPRACRPEPSAEVDWPPPTTADRRRRHCRQSIDDAGPGQYCNTCVNDHTFTPRASKHHP